VLTIIGLVVSVPEGSNARPRMLERLQRPPRCI